MSTVAAAYEGAKLASDFDPQNRDENVAYYVAKLDELVKKFGRVTPRDDNQTCAARRLAF